MKMFILSSIFIAGGYFALTNFTVATYVLMVSEYVKELFEILKSYL